MCGEISKSVPSARWSRFWSRVSSAAFPLRGPDPTRGVWTKTIPVELRDELLRDSVSEYLRIDALASCLCRGQGLKFLHFLQPLIQTAGRRLTVKEEGLLKSSRKIADPEVFALFCRAVAMRSTEIIDLTRLFDDIDDDVFVDDGHLNRFGNYHVATRIARELTTRGIVNSQNVR
ncbi:MAG TPA: hypothetical protein DDZ51_10975 [Planctomycetaceae bacterium]|nr:hypothetical protein [Planctomycetaceae bacterium]